MGRDRSLRRGPADRRPATLGGRRGRPGPCSTGPGGGQRRDGGRCDRGLRRVLLPGAAPGRGRRLETGPRRPCFREHRRVRLAQGDPMSTLAKLEAFRVRLPLVHEFETSSHRKSSLEHILVRLEAEDGTVGWGEIASPSAPFYSSETVETCWWVLQKHLGPALLAHSWTDPAQAGLAWARIRGHNFAKAGLDIAAW